MLKSLIEKTINEDFNVTDRKEALNLFSWLIADEIIDLKIAICKDTNGDYHDKLAIFEDDNNNVVGCSDSSIIKKFFEDNLPYKKSYSPLSSKRSIVA